ncbi:MAG: OmpH family outer membrane protein [Verrucomicrobia bacterium]|nr:OmpH family outer membrane protein [Verrucomicrobiota bacterium]
MKNTIHSLVAAAAFGALTLGASAQPAIKLAVVDMAKLYDNHYKTLEQNAKLQADDQKAQEEVDKMNKEGNSLVEEYKALNDQSTNPTLTADAKAKAQNDAQRKLEAIQQKKNEIGTFVQNTRNSIQQRLQTFRSLMLEEISKVVADVAKKKGATLVLDKSGPTFIGISNLVYADAAYEITDDIAAEINKGRPASATPAPSAPTPPASAKGSPSVTVPGLTPPAKK